jgi:hypothetical protein
MCFRSVSSGGLCEALAGDVLAVAAPGRSQLVAVGGLDVLQRTAVVRQCGSDGTLPGGLGSLDGLPVCDERRVWVLLGCAHGDHFFPRGRVTGQGYGLGLAFSALSRMTLLFPRASALIPAAADQLTSLRSRLLAEMRLGNDDIEQI